MVISKRLWWPVYLQFVRQAFGVLVLMIDPHVFGEMAKAESSHAVDYSEVWQRQLSLWFKEYLKEVLFPEAYKIGNFLFQTRLNDFGDTITNPTQDKAATHFDELVQLNRQRVLEDLSNVLGIVIKDGLYKQNDEFVEFLESRYDSDVKDGIIDPDAILDECEKGARERKEMLMDWKTAVLKFESELKAFKV